MLLESFTWINDEVKESNNMKNKSTKIMIFIHTNGPIFGSSVQFLSSI